MARWEKLLAEMLSDPRPSAYTYSEVTSILEALGFALARRSAGSHRIWHRKMTDPSASGGFRTVNIGLVDTGRGTLKAVYVKEALRVLRDNNLIP